MAAESSTIHISKRKKNTRLAFEKGVSITQHCLEEEQNELVVIDFDGNRESIEGSDVLIRKP